MTTPFYERLSRLDQVISAGPAGARVATDLLPLFEEETSRDYFLDNLSDPAWLQPLREAGFFDSPPAPVRVSEDATMIPLWRESRYLARMAEHAPDLVRDIILCMPPTTNGRVHEDFAQAAIKMPPHIAVDLLPRISKGLSSALGYLPSDSLEGLVVHLVTGGQAEVALEFAREMLTVLPDNKTQSSTDLPVARSPEPRAKLTSWTYERIVQKCLPSLVDGAGLLAVEMLCRLLQDAVRFSLTRPEELAPDDLSVIWRPAIEESRQNHSSGVRDVLVSAVRDGCERLAGSDVGQVRRLIAILETFPWRVFHRIALHLLRSFPETVLDLIAKRLTDRQCFENVGLRHEHCLLLGACFKQLSGRDQAIILDWIGSGPSFESPVGLTSQEERLRECAWQRNWLSLISDDLPPTWRRKYKQLVSAVGEAEHPEFPVYFSGLHVGPTSPKEASDLGSKNAGEIVDYLNAWEQPAGPFAPTPEGLGRVLQQSAASNSPRFSKEAVEFQRTQEPTYVSAVFRGLRDACKQNKRIHWRPVLRLAKWVLAQPREMPERRTEHGHGRDPDWGWCRQSIAALIEESLSKQNVDLPYGLRNEAWAVLATLTEDPDPTAQHEDEYGGSNTDPATMSINTVRGVAMHATILYGLWVKEQMSRKRSGTEGDWRGLDDAPEVRRVLDAHLDPCRDSSLAIRSVYGRWFPQLVHLDARWTQDNLGSIFPSDPSLRALRAAAWESYLVFCQLYGSVYDILQQEYVAATERIGATSRDRRVLGNPEERLTEHLMIAYWWGKLELEELAHLFRVAPPELRGHALDYIGRNLQGFTGRVPQRTLARLRRLWEWRLNETSRLPMQGQREELKAFGWWFLSGRFGERWAMKQLRQVLERTQWIEPDDDIVARLAEMSSQLPFIAATCLGHISEGDEQGWAIRGGWHNNGRSILQTAIQSPSTAARRTAVNVINRLGERGFLQFRDLLNLL